MPKTKTRIWDPAEHLITEEDMAAYLEAALQEGDAALIAAALGDIARAKGMSQIAHYDHKGRFCTWIATARFTGPGGTLNMRFVAIFDDSTEMPAACGMSLDRS